MLDDLKDVWTTGRRWCCGNLSACSSTCLTLAKFERGQSKVWCCWVVVIKVRKSSIFLLHHYQTCEQTLLALSAWTSMLRCQQFSEARITGIEIFCRAIVQFLVGKSITQWLFQSKILWILKKSIILLLLATYFAEKGFKAWRHHFPETTCFILSQIYTLDL